MQRHELTRKVTALRGGTVEVVRVKCACGVMFTGDADNGAARHLEAVAAGRTDLAMELAQWAGEEFARADDGR